MTKRDESTPKELEAAGSIPPERGGDDRRGEVKPTDNPVPRSPEAEEDAVRAGEEKLERVKPY